MTTLTPFPENFELYAPTVEERLLQAERELGLAPTLADPLTQRTMLDRVIGLERRLVAMQTHLGLSAGDLRRLSEKP
jgi:hypothetical protein